MSYANSAVTASYQPQAPAGQETLALRFTGLILVSAIVLQRFGVFSGASYLSVVAPVGLMLAALGVMQNGLAISRGRMMIFIALLAWIMFGGVMQVVFPANFGTPPSWLSLVEFIALTGFGVLTFAEPVDEQVFFRLVNATFLALAIAGIVQFVVQFAGLSLFSFQGFVPPKLLLEGIFNTSIAIGSSHYLKSNGLFLVEPSVFSQFMALAIIIEILMFRRLLYVSCFAAALMFSLSGTGWLMILGFILTASFSLGVRGLVLSFVTAAVGFLAIASLALFFPSGFDFFISRMGEINAVGSSGHYRFVTPWWLAGYVFSHDPWAALYGLGAGASEHLMMAPVFKYIINPPVKISIEFGIPGFVLYLAFLLAARRTSTQKALLVPVLIMLLLDGGNTMFAPVLFPCLMMILVPDLRPAGRTRDRLRLAERSVPANLEPAT